MTNDVKKVPELRFPEFSGEWEEKMLGDVLTILDGDRGKNYPSGSDFLEYGHTLFLNASNVTKNGFSFTLKQYITEKKSISMGNGKLVKDDVVLTTRGSIGNIGWYDEEIYREIPYARINSGMLILRSNNKDMASFVSQFLMSTKGKRQIDRISFGSAQPQLTKKDIKLYRIDFPQIKEQQKIGEFFSKLDRQIELEEQKLAKLEEQKQGYMQKIFSQELRFKDESGNEYPEWEDKLISDIGKVVTGNTPSKKDNDYWNSNQYVWVTPTDISNKKNIYTSGYQLSQKGFSKARQLPKNTLLITCIASIGKNAILRIEGSCNQQINAVIPNDNYDVDYLYYAFEDVSKLMKSIAGKTATQIVNKAVFEKLLLNVPIYEEQQKISGFLNKVDILIDKQTQKIDELKLRKQGFLQKMFV